MERQARIAPETGTVWEWQPISKRVFQAFIDYVWGRLVRVPTGLSPEWIIFD